MSTKFERYASWLFTLVLFAIWELICRAFKVSPIILPAPSDIMGAFIRYSGPILRNSLITLWTTLAGFLIAVGFGLLLGLLVGWSRTIYRLSLIHI